jgi:hypothetical protein
LTAPTAARIIGRSRGAGAIMTSRGLCGGGLVLLSSAAFGQDARIAVNESMVEAASALIASVARGPGGNAGIMGFDKAKNLALTLDDEARESWTYWPTERVGVPLDLMTAEQRRLTQDLLTSLLSVRGHLKVVQIMQLEQILGMLDTIGFPRGVGHYEIVLFGAPSATAPWSWRFEGHHVSLNVAVAPAGISVTPTFLGSNPGEVRNGPLTGLRVLGEEEDLGRQLVSSLTETQRSRAIVSVEAPRDIFTGNLGKERDQWEAWRATLLPAGIGVAELNEVQQHWVRRILDEVVGVYRPEVAGEILRGIDPRTLSFAWMGATEPGAPHYFRLQGDDFVFEYDNVQDGANHVHSVWRDESADFGRNVLGEHYRTAHVHTE